jgi:redox-sensing transcriptional repressor
MPEIETDSGAFAPPGGAPPAKIPKAVIKRLSRYSRVLQELELKGVEKASSRDLAEALGVNSAQVRKDLTYFGQFGIPGVGYYVRELRAQIKRILRTDREVRVALVGVGNLGSALMSYGGFQRQNFRIVAAFDSAPAKIGRMQNGAPVLDIARLQEELRSRAVDIVILATPGEAAQIVCDLTVKAGIKAILNFVPTRLTAPPDVAVHDVDLSIEMESLAFYLR